MSKGITLCFRLLLLNLACSGCTPLSPVLMLLVLSFTGKEIGVMDIARVCNAVVGPWQNIIPRQCLRLLGMRGKTTGEREYLGMVRYFKQRQKEGDNYYFAIDLGYSVTLCSIFWADGRA